MYVGSTDPQFDPEVVAATVDLLESLTQDGRALEFGLCTGGIAPPLSARGVTVHGIDMSPAMVEQFHREAGRGVSRADR